MMKKIRYLGAILTLATLAIFSLALGSPLPFMPASGTPTPKGKLVVPLEAQAGRSDGILVLGFCLFLIIAIPVILRYKNLRAGKQDAR